MAGKQAKLVRDSELDVLRAQCDATRYPARNWFICMLSFKAGLRAVEISRAQRSMMLDLRGELDEQIILPNWACKKGSGRSVAMPRGSVLWEAANAYFSECPGRAKDPLIWSERAESGAWAQDHDEPRAMRPDAVAYIFYKIYRKAGLSGCSSHSGRRTFGTKAARTVTSIGGSLRDVQYLLGHKNLNTTQRYIEVNEEIHARLALLV